MELTDEQRERIRQNRERALNLQKRFRESQSPDNSKNSVRTSTKHGLEKTNVDGDDNTKISEDNDNNNNNEESKMKRQKDDINISKVVHEGNGYVRRKEMDNGGTRSGDVRNGNDRDDTDKKDDDDDDDDDEIEAFEENASEYVTKQEAMKVYCLPLGTLEVCTFVEKPNPRNKTWQSMKLYHRKEIRHRAHVRYGGISGLINERNQRNQLKLQRDLEQSKDIFK